MKIDFSTIFLVILAVIPGLFAQRSRNLVAPRSLEAQGASAEFAELVALGIATHGVLAYLAAFCFILAGEIFRRSPLYFFHRLDALHVGQWCALHITEASLIAAAYVLVSFCLSYILGFVYGVLRLQSPLPRKLLVNGSWLARLGVRGVLAERPIIYEALNAKIENGIAKLVFVELEMKDGLGFYSGQLDQFAIVRDEEPHKPIFIINAYFKMDRDGIYEELRSDAVMIDLADVAILQIKQVAEDSLQIENP